MKKLILTLFIPLLFISCGDDFTNLGPKTQRNVTNFYKNQTDFELAIRGSLDGLQSSQLFGVNFVLFMEMRADNGANGGGASGLAASLEQLDTFTDLPSGDEIAATYDAAYNVIASTNNILSRIDGVDFDSQTVKDQIKGEALFVRSLVYYHLAIIFGNVPLQLEEVTTPDVEVNQVDAATIYAQAITDLETAEGLLPETGRITKWAAAALNGRVQLANGNPSGAEAPLRRVIGSMQYDLVPVYADIWGAANEGNIESIFEIEYISGNVGEGSAYTDMYTPNGVGGGVGGGVAPQNVTDDLVNAFDVNDERFEGSLDTVGQGPGNWWVTKFDSSPSTAFDGPNNWIEIRYAEVLLNLAEALGESGEAYDLIDEVRVRTNLGPIDRTPLGGTFEEKLLQERRFEFAFENKRWADLLRFGKAKEVMAAQLGITEAEVTLLFPIPEGVIDVSPESMTQNSEHQ
ncbi:MAG: RagB/SusD family nutrient uptake outer membrane protein [Balneola sp.]